MSAPARPVRPRDAASLIPIRRAHGQAGDTYEVLMGRRARAHRFLPDVYVFPGGRVDSDDTASPAVSELRETVMQQLRAHCTPARARALAIAAARETFEETGLLLGEQRSQGIAPALDRLDYAMRAITPTDSPIRFHARFFIAEISPADGAVRSNGELLDLDWRPLGECLRLPLADITEYLLLNLDRIRTQAPDDAALFAYQGSRAMIRRPNERQVKWTPRVGRRK